MKINYIKYIATIIILAFSLAVAQNPIAVVMKTKGKITIKKSDGKKTDEVKKGSKLFDGDEIQTDKDGNIAITFLDDKSLLRIRPNSTCRISAKKEQNTFAKNVYVEVGTIFSKITKQKTQFNISTPTSVASVKGTIVWTVQEFKSATYFHCEEGLLEISNEEGSALLKADETAVVNSSKSKPLVRKTKPGERPTLDEEELDIDSFEFEFQNSDGNKRELKFKIEQKK